MYKLCNNLYNYRPFGSWYILNKNKDLVHIGRRAQHLNFSFIIFRLYMIDSDSKLRFWFLFFIVLTTIWLKLLVLVRENIVLSFKLTSFGLDLILGSIFITSSSNFKSWDTTVASEIFLLSSKIILLSEENKEWALT